MMLQDLRSFAIENRRILVIDDNLAIHEDFRKTLATTMAQYELDQAGAPLRCFFLVVVFANA